MARLVPTETTSTDGRFALLDDTANRVIGYGHIEISFVPPTNDGAILNGLSFVLEPRTADHSNEDLMVRANNA